MRMQRTGLSRTSERSGNAASHLACISVLQMTGSFHFLHMHQEIRVAVITTSCVSLNNLLLFLCVPISVWVCGLDFNTSGSSCDIYLLVLSVSASFPKALPPSFHHSLPLPLYIRGRTRESDEAVADLSCCLHLLSFVTHYIPVL